MRSVCGLSRFWARSSSWESRASLLLNQLFAGESMSVCSRKLYLENRIFARAAALGARVDAKRGRLVCAHPDAELKACLGVYNVFFACENARCLPREDWRRFWQIFDEEARRLGPCSPYFPGCPVRRLNRKIRAVGKGNSRPSCARAPVCASEN